MHDQLPVSVRALVEASLADNTHRSYGGVIKNFKSWCAERRKSPLPAEPLTIAEYLSDLVTAGRRGSTLKVHAAAIAYDHRRADMENPIDSYLVRAVLRGAMRLRGGYVGQKRPVVSEELALILQHMPPTLRGLRDRAMIALGFAGAFRRSELAALRLEDLTFSERGLTVCIRRSKTDFERKGTSIGIPNGRYLKPVEALQKWIAAAGITRGPIFRPVFHDYSEARSITPYTVSRVLKTYLDKANLDATQYGAHSLRAGFITDAADFGVDVERIMDHSRHATRNSVKIYVRRANLFRNHPGEGFL
ncbi:site-specific integrase [Devosia sp.]|uniref:site-specific integrase n=1 Tax=Devosia sp. TaxID=1871048 RepID=UPI002732B230|nr:site-specific integrase [Devosia sp.]MDP2782167.1 site-specific integrase [Devosia sp.]